MDQLSTNLAELFYHYLSLGRRSTCSHALSINQKRKVRIHRKTFETLLCHRRRFPSNKKILSFNENRTPTSVKSLEETESNHERLELNINQHSNAQKTIKNIRSSSASSCVPSPSDSRNQSYSSISDVDRSTSESSKTRLIQCQKQLESLVNLGPVINKNFHRSSQEHLPENYDHDFELEQLFRCPKDPRPKRRKCCGVYYDLFRDAWDSIEGWFTLE